MAIKNNTTIDGTLLTTLTQTSSRRVIKICDNCQIETQISIYDLFSSRKRRNTSKDLCHKCACKIYNTGEGNPAKKLSSRQKISEALHGRSKKYNRNRILGRKVDTRGYIETYDESIRKYKKEHRVIIEKELGRNLLSNEKIHHVDNEKANNAQSNLFLCSSETQHQKLHRQLQKLAFELVKDGLILFSHERGEYYLNSEEIDGLRE